MTDKIVEFDQSYRDCKNRPELKKITDEELEHVLDLHREWTEDPYGEKGQRADLSGYDLSNRNLSHRNLDGIILNGADLKYTKLYGTCLTCSQLRGANLRYAWIYGTDLTVASLYGANLEGARITCSHFDYAKLTYSNLAYARIENSSLLGATLDEAIFYRAHLENVDFTNTHLEKAKHVPYIPMACPDTGAFIAWKICVVCSKNTIARPVVVKLLIPSDAKRTSASGRKCRADKAIVLEIQDENGNPINVDEAFSMHDRSFKYKVGETVVPCEPFNENRWDECTSGIHFFINREEVIKRF